MKLIKVFFEWLITKFTRDSDTTFFDVERFPWTRELEAGTADIRRELDEVLRERDSIPNFQEISENQRGLTNDDRWKTFFLYAYGKCAEVNRQRCPQTDRLLRRIPGMKTAMFSILAGGKHLPEHCGPYKGVLRYHLGLIIPRPEEQCRIRVGKDVRSWSEGKSLIFDDRHPHEAWNDSDRDRVVLFVDFLRPLPLPLALINRLIVWIVSLTPYVTVGYRRVLAAAQAARSSREPNSGRSGAGPLS